MRDNAGWSTCPICGLHWLVTPLADCLAPACGCYGTDTSEANPDRPCESCGIIHAWTCPKLPGVVAQAQAEEIPVITMRLTDDE